MDRAPASRLPVVPVVPVVAPVLALGGGAALLMAERIGFISEAAEQVSTLLWLGGWVVIVWALLLLGAQLVTLGVQLHAHRSVSRWDACSVGATTLLLGVVIASHPLWGTGSGVGG
ncbi:hypothetical protein ACX80L_11335 [Arthrobacter sp. MDT1-48-3]